MPLFSFLNRKSGIGIDFGTHKSAVSLTSTDGKNTQLVDLPIAVDNRRFTAQSIPTRASILETDEGEFDIRLANWHTSQLNTTHLRRFKLDIGRGWKENATPVKKTSGKNKNDITVEGLTARLLRFLGNRTLDTAKNEKRDISKSIWVIAVPSTWGYHQRRATLFAAKGAFLDNATIIDEPIAAAIYLSEILKIKLPLDGYTLVIDIGAGTTDLALIEKNGEKLLVKRSESLPFGGNNIDDSLYAFLDNRAKSEQKALIDPEAFPEIPLGLKAEFLLENIRERKENLNDIIIARDKSTEDPFLDELIYKSWVRKVSADLSLTPNDFEQVVEREMLNLQELILKFLTSKPDETNRIKSVMLVGGGSKIFSSKSIVEEAFQVYHYLGEIPEVHQVIDEPEWAVTKGAAYYSWLIAHHPQMVKLTSDQSVGIILPENIEILQGNLTLKADIEKPLELSVTDYILFKTKAEFAEIKIKIWYGTSVNIVDSITIHAKRKNNNINIPHDAIIGIRYEIKQDRLIHFDQPYGAADKDKLEFTVIHSLYPYEEQRHSISSQIVDLRKIHNLT